MKQLRQYLNQLQKNFTGPQLKVICQEKGKEEGFCSSYAGGSITLQAKSLLSAAYGINLLSVGAASGHLAEFLGERTPIFPLRPLWFQGIAKYDEMEYRCRRVIELGYNALLFPLHGNEENIPSEVFSMIHDFGLQIILKPQWTPPKDHASFLDPEYRKKMQNDLLCLQENIPQMDYLFWEGTCTHPRLCQHPHAKKLKKFLQSDLALMEVRMLEETLQKHCSLIYYLPCQDFLTAQHQASWASLFFDDVGPKTIISFSSVAGDPTLDHLPPHPFWNMLRQSPDISFTPLLPIVNTGAVGQGEGFWPTLTFDLAEQFISRCHRHRFIGALSLIKHLPEKGALLDCSLWVTSQMLWSRNPTASPLAETWFAALRPDLDFPPVEKECKQLRHIARELSYLRSMDQGDECRALAESMMAQLNQLDLAMRKYSHRSSSENNRPSFHDYFTYFIRDARRMIEHCLQRHHIPIINRSTDENGGQSFWTEMRGGREDGLLGSATEITFLDEPNQGDGMMRLIYEETVDRK